MAVTETLTSALQPLGREHARRVALLNHSISRELGIEPLRSIEDAIRLFDTPWLEDGAGLAMETNGTLAGFGWARDLTWAGDNYTHVGLFLARDHRAPEAHRELTEPLLDLARDIGRRYGRTRALALYVSVDTIHPPILRQLGFRDHPTMLIGFRHDLRRIPEMPIPPGIRIRPARLAEEKAALMQLGREAFAGEGSPLHEDYWDILIGEESPRRPGFSLVAEDSNGPVGYIIAGATEAPRKTIQVIETAVSRPARKRGIGSALFTHILQQARTRHLTAVHSGTFSTTRATVLHWRCGFRPDAARTYYYLVRPLIG
jgi:GNAT superfamily N-acetyltransferase